MNIKNKFNELFTKHYNIILLVFSGCMLLMLIIMSMYFAFSGRSIKKNELASLEQTITQAANNVDNIISSVKFTMEFMCTSDDVLEQLIYDNDGEYNDQLDNLQEAWDLAVVVANYRYIHDVKFYIDDRKAISRERMNYFGLSYAETQPWYKKLIEKPSGSLWISPYNDVDRLSDTDAAEQNVSEVFSYISTVKNYKESIMKPVAIIRLDCESRNIYKVLNSISLPGRLFLGICDENNKIIFSDNEALLGRNIEDGNNGTWNKKDLKISADIAASGWRLVAVMPKNTFFGAYMSSNVLTLLAASIVVFCVMLVILLYIMFSNNFIRRVSGMVSEFEIKGGRDDILDNRLERILNNYKEVLVQKYEGEILIKEAELKALQSQINPHFLYNTLDSVNWLIRKEDTVNAGKMLNDLAGYFRSSLSKNEDIVTIKSEMEIVGTYMRIQKYRFENKFIYESHFDDDVLKYKIPKLTIQPFLENALLHGIDSRSGKICKINVSAVEEDDHILICVSDNGKGMTQEQTDKLFEDGGGYGIYNVNRRLQLFSDNREGYGIEVRSQLGRYTTVLLKIIKKL
ncbi:MAG: sensor histidine kinase [Clostridia bacterium]|nr:sensor histidine kinase [Clostridia bacterium]